jgi:hypothetical protein
MRKDNVTTDPFVYCLQGRVEMDWDTLDRQRCMGALIAYNKSNDVGILKDISVIFHTSFSKLALRVEMFVAADLGRWLTCGIAKDREGRGGCARAAPRISHTRAPSSRLSLSLATIPYS